MRAPLAAALVLLAAGCLGPSGPDHEDEAPPAAHAPAATGSPIASAPYAGQQAREIKALTAEEIEGYQKGAGLGYAKPAELNSYPGPLHALEMADQLGLTQEQKDALTQLRADMLAQVVPLGAQYLIAEGALEQAFRDSDVSTERLKALLDESARIGSQLRYAHLVTHLDTRALLTTHQIALYDEARGYGKADHASHAHG